MGDATAIAWTDHTWNAWMGCQRVSQGCVHCYAETLTKGRMKLEVFGAKSRRKRTGRSTWSQPKRWNRTAFNEGRPHRVFLGSLMDIFEDAPGPNEWREEVWEVIRTCHWLDFQLLTKRPENIEKMLPDTWTTNPWGFWPNVWLGTSIEDQRVAERAPILTAIPAQVHFVSYEPAIGPLHLGKHLDAIEWMIVGGESGPGYRRMELDWARDMQGHCALSETAFFFKQNSAPRTEMGIDALGRIYRAYPTSWDRRIP